MDEFFEVGERMAAMKGGASPGSLVVLVAGVPIGVRGSTNLLRVLIIPPSDQAPKLC
jgi:pyruvate kinase